MLSSRRSSMTQTPPDQIPDKSSEGSSEDASSSSRSLLSKIKVFARQGSGDSVASDSSDPTPITSALSQVVIAEKDFSKLGTTVRQVLEHPSLGPKFREFAKSFHADEGIQFLDDLALVNTAATAGEDHYATAKRMMEKYFMDGAACWVNLPDNIHAELLDTYQSGKYQSVPALFESAMYETFTDLKKSDTFRKFCLADNEAKSFANDADMILLDSFITPERFRLALAAVEEAEGGEADPERTTSLTNLIRFCASVSEYERSTSSNDKERKARGQKIASMFVQSGAQFQVDLPAMYTAAVVKGNYDKVLPDAKIECLQVLSKHEPLMLAARKLNASRAQSVKLSAISPSPSPAPVMAHVGSDQLQQLFSKDGALGRELIAKCNANKLDSSIVNKIKFLAATAAFMEIPASTTNKQATGRKIVSLFVQPGATFEISDLGTGFVDDLISSNADYARILPVVFHNVLSDVASITEVTQLAAQVSAAAAAAASV